MDIARDIETIRRQEEAALFGAFDEAQAFALGSRLREMGLAGKLPIIIDIRLWDRPLFHCALPGSTAANFEWAQRKINSVRLYQKSTYRMFLEQGAKSKIFPEDYGHSAADHAIAGGAFPIMLKGMGVIGAVAVSGLPQRSDHNLVFAGLVAHLGLDVAELALSDDGQ